MAGTETVRICGRCGLYAPASAVLCDGCAADLRQHARKVDRQPWRMASARLMVACAHCRTEAPVRGVVPQAFCPGCERLIPLGESTWAAVLGALHGVADLHGDDPEGHQPSPYAIDELNPLREGARTASGLRLTADEGDNQPLSLPAGLRAYVGPGHPISGETLEPLVLSVQRPGRVIARTVAAGQPRSVAKAEVAHYEVQSRYLALYSPLLGVIADEHRVDRPEPDAKLDGSRLHCTRCDTRMHRAEGSVYRVRCNRCGLVHHVPLAFQRSSGGDPLWLLFEGPSPLRSQLERAPGTQPPPGSPGDRPVGRLPRLEETPVGRLVQLLVVLLLPTAALVVVALLALWAR